MPLGMEVGLVPSDFVFDGDPAHPRKNGTEVDFGPGHIVLDRDPAPR